MSDAECRVQTEYPAAVKGLCPVLSDSLRIPAGMVGLGPEFAGIQHFE